MTERQNIINELLVDKIIKRIASIENDYQKAQGIILTEDDLKCLIFHFLYEMPELKHDTPLYDEGTNGSPLHSEITFFDMDGKLHLKPDITIINPYNYSILHSIEGVHVNKENKLVYKATSSKEYEFGGKCIVIELKFYKGKKGITTFKGIENDIDKIKKLQDIAHKNTQQKTWGIMVVFNKTDIESREFKLFRDGYANNPDIKFVYCTGKVIF
ncbi:MAG: hypothetical protein FWF46_09520 [Oscillospiraceae bacterium]|nr:hypothetical protein [Oscillospiraceae bacterium]